MHQDYPFITFQPYSYIHQHRARHPTWVHRSHGLYGTCLQSLRLGSHVDTCLLRCGKISYLFDPPQCYSFIRQHYLKRIRLTLSSFSLFLSSSSFFVVFIPRADRGVFYMRVLENSADSVDLSRRVSDVLNTYGGGEFDSCEGSTRHFIDDTLESVS